MLAKKFDKPKRIGESNSILDIKTSSADDFNPPKIYGVIYGIKKKTIILTETIAKEKNKKTLLIKSLAESSDVFVFSIIKGTKTEIEIIEPIVTKIKSGILKAE